MLCSFLYILILIKELKKVLFKFPILYIFVIDFMFGFIFLLSLLNKTLPYFSCDSLVHLFIIFCYSSSFWRKSQHFCLKILNISILLKFDQIAHAWFLLNITTFSLRKFIFLAWSATLQESTICLTCSTSIATNFWGTWWVHLKSMSTSQICGKIVVQ